MTYRNGDIVKLSALSIMQEHGTTELSCVILDSRRYRDAKGAFSYEAYICAPASNPEANANSESLWRFIDQLAGKGSP